MRLAIVHGYFLADSGSGIYVRELVKSFVQLGHDVTLVCQDHAPERYDFIDTAYSLDSDNRRLNKLFERARGYAGSCRFVRPDVHALLLTYVASGERTYENHTLQTAAQDKIDTYVDDNIEALTTIFRRWPPDAVQANHAIMQPFEVMQALRGAGLDDIGYAMTIHGSALNFSVKTDPRLVPYFSAAAKQAQTLVALSESSADDVRDFARSVGLDISGKTRVIPPGVDTDLFRPLPHFPARKRTVGVFAGRLIWTKGPQYAIAAMPFILRSNPDFELKLAGEGPLEPVLRRMIEMLAAGDIQGAAEHVRHMPEMGAPDGWGAVIPSLEAGEAESYAAAARELPARVTFLGHLTHEEMAAAFAAGDVALMPSVFPEAYGLAVIEAAAAGAVPVATYQTGLRAPLDILARELEDPGLLALRANGDLTRDLAAAVTRVLAHYSTKEFAHRQRLHETAVRGFSWERTALAYLASF